QLLELPEGAAAVELLRAGDVTGRVLVASAHVEEHVVLVAGELGRGDRSGHEGGQLLDRGEVAGDRVDAHAQEVVAQLVRLVPVAGQEDHRRVLAFGVEGPGRIGGAAGGRRHGQGADDGTAVDLVDTAGVQQDCPAGFEPAAHVGRLQ